MSSIFLLLLDEDGDAPPPPEETFRITNNGELREDNDDNDRIIN